MRIRKTFGGKKAKKKKFFFEMGNKIEILFRHIDQGDTLFVIKRLKRYTSPSKERKEMFYIMRAAPNT